MLRALLREARERAGLDQRPLSLKIGKSYSFVNKVESGVRNIDVVEVLSWIRATGTDRDRFFRDYFDRLDRL